MTVSERDVRHVAELARLHVEDDEIVGLVGHFTGIMAHFNALARAGEEGRLPLDDLSPVVFAHDEISPLRADEVVESSVGRAVLDAAPDAREGFFVVPRIMEGDE